MPEFLDNRSFNWIIDAADQIVQVNEAWLAFARENGAPESSAAMVLDQPLWRFIQGRETAYLYQQIFSRLRAGNSPIKFPFRCDSPDCRRFMEMKLSLLAGAAIEFQARLLRQEFRQPQDFLGTSGQVRDLLENLQLVQKNLYCGPWVGRDRGSHRSWTSLATRPCPG